MLASGAGSAGVASAATPQAFFCLEHAEQDRPSLFGRLGSGHAAQSVAESVAALQARLYVVEKHRTIRHTTFHLLDSFVITYVRGSGTWSTWPGLSGRWNGGRSGGHGQPHSNKPRACMHGRTSLLGTSTAPGAVRLLRAQCGARQQGDPPDQQQGPPRLLCCTVAAPLQPVVGPAEKKLRDRHAARRPGPARACARTRNTHCTGHMLSSRSSSMWLERARVFCGARCSV